MAGILIALVILLPWAGALFVWLARNQRPKLQHTLAILFSISAAVASVILLGYASAEPAIQIPLGSAFGVLTFVPDGLGVTLTAIATVIGSLAVIFSMEYMRGDEQLGRYYFLVLFFIGAMTGLVLSGNLLFTFFFWEITALCSYGLISFYNDDPKAVAGGIKALIITQVGGVGLLAGTLVAYAALGSFQISDLIAKSSTLPAASLAFIAFSFLIAAAAKSAQFPFHTWLPDAMEAPSPVSALIHAATMVNAGDLSAGAVLSGLRSCARLADSRDPGGIGFGFDRVPFCARCHGPQTGAGLFHGQPAGIHGVCHRRGQRAGQPVSSAQPCILQSPVVPGGRVGHSQCGHARSAAHGRAGGKDALCAQCVHHRRAGPGGGADPQRFLEQGADPGGRVSRTRPPGCMYRCWWASA